MATHAAAAWPIQEQVPLYHNEWAMIQLCCCRRRALELVYALVNEGNIKTLTKELLDYLKVSDVEFKPDLTSKICMLVQRFAPDKQWHLDSLLQVSLNPPCAPLGMYKAALLVCIQVSPSSQVLHAAYGAAEAQPYTECRAQLMKLRDGHKIHDAV